MSICAYNKKALTEMIKADSEKLGEQYLSVETKRDFSISFENKTALLEKWDAEYRKRRRRNIIIISIIAVIVALYLGLFVYGYIKMTYINRTYEGYMWVQGDLDEGYEEVTVKLKGKGSPSSYYDFEKEKRYPCLSFRGEVTVLKGEEQLYHYTTVSLSCALGSMHSPWRSPLDRSIPTISAVMRTDALISEIIIYPCDEDDQYTLIEGNKYGLEWNSDGSTIIYASFFDDPDLTKIDKLRFSYISHYTDNRPK